MFLTLALTLAAPVPRDKPVLYFPTAVGAKWTYERGAAGMAAEVSVVGEADGGLVAVSRPDWSDPARSHWTRYRVSGSGLEVVAVGRGWGKNNLDDCKPDVLLKLPAKAGERWEGTIPGTRDTLGWKSVRTTVGVERVKVPAGEYEAVRVDEELMRPNCSSTISSWYAPGVGLVKETRRRDPADGRGVTVTTVLQLKSFTAAGR